MRLRDDDPRTFAADANDRVGVPGKAALTQRLVRTGSPTPQVARAIDPIAAAVQRRQIERAIDASFSFCEDLAPVQRAVDGHTGLSDDAIGAHAAAGVAGAGGPLPHLGTIQRAFGPDHDLSSVRAHVGGAAAEASTAIGAHAYATGNDVAFASSPDLFLAAHEATHVVQQRQGVHLKGAVGQAGDRYEQHADDVAAAVVRGEDVSAMLGAGGHSGAGAVQRKGKGKGKGKPQASEPQPETTIDTGTFEIYGSVPSSQSPPETTIDTGTFEIYGSVPSSPPPPRRRGDMVVTADGAPVVDGNVVLRSTNQVVFAYVFPSVPDHSAIMIKSGEKVVFGSEHGAKLATGVWTDERTVSWTATFERPVTSEFWFKVLDGDGSTLYSGSKTIAVQLASSLMSAATLDHLETRSTEKLRWVDDELLRWRNATMKAYVGARHSVVDAITADTRDGQTADAVCLALLSAVIGGVVGGLAKSQASSVIDRLPRNDPAIPVSPTGKNIVEGVLSDGAKAVPAQMIGAGGRWAAVASGGLPEAEMSKFIEFDEQARQTLASIYAALDAAHGVDTKGEPVKRADPIAIVDAMTKEIGLPFAPQLEIDLERQMWKRWLAEAGADVWSSQALESPVAGWNYNRIIARCAELGIAAADPDAINRAAAYHDGEQYLAEEAAFDERKASETKADAATAKAAKEQAEKDKAGFKKRYGAIGD